MRVSTSDTGTGTFWLFLSILICIGSYRLGLGGYHNPGPGFLPFWTGVVCGVLSSILLISTLRKKRKSNGGGGIFEKVKWRDVILVVASMLIYAAVLEKIGFVISTMIFVGALLRIIGQLKLRMVAIVAVSTALASYAIFELWLHTQLPKGLLGI